MQVVGLIICLLLREGEKKREIKGWNARKKGAKQKLHWPQPAPLAISTKIIIRVWCWRCSGTDMVVKQIIIAFKLQRGWCFKNK